MEVRLNVPEGEDNPGNINLAEDVYGPFSGQVTSTARQGFRRAVQEGNPRLVEAMFLCQVSTASDALSGIKCNNLYDVTLFCLPPPPNPHPPSRVLKPKLNWYHSAAQSGHVAGVSRHGLLPIMSSVRPLCFHAPLTESHTAVQQLRWHSF